MDEDWEARANREAAAIIAQTGAYGQDYRILTDLMAVAWLQGVQFGTHAALDDVNNAFNRLQEDLR